MAQQLDKEAILEAVNRLTPADQEAIAKEIMHRLSRPPYGTRHSRASITSEERTAAIGRLAGSLHDPEHPSHTLEDIQQWLREARDAKYGA